MQLILADLCHFLLQKDNALFGAGSYFCYCYCQVDGQMEVAALRLLARAFKVGFRGVAGEPVPAALTLPYAYGWTTGGEELVSVMPDR